MFEEEQTHISYLKAKSYTKNTIVVFVLWGSGNSFGKFWGNVCGALGDIWGGLGVSYGVGVWEIAGSYDRFI